MEDIILKIFENGLTLSNILLLVEALIATFLGIACYKYIAKLVSYWQFCKNPLIAEGIEVTTSFDGINLVSGTIEKATPNRVELFDENRRVIAISLREFMKRTWRFENG